MHRSVWDRILRHLRLRGEPLPELRFYHVPFRSTVLRRFVLVKPRWNVLRLSLLPIQLQLVLLLLGIGRCTGRQPRSERTRIDGQLEAWCSLSPARAQVFWCLRGGLLDTSGSSFLWHSSLASKGLAPIEETTPSSS